MPLRARGGKWDYRFKLDGKEYSGTTDLAATKQNVREAQDKEAEHRHDLKEGRNPTRRLVVRTFGDAAKEFLDWAKTHYREHPNSYARIATSFSSAKVFFGATPVSLLHDHIEQYKAWRVIEHGVRDVTLRHDLHALSKFFGFAIKHRWSRDNPIRNVEVPSDEDAIRIHVLTIEEEKQYFARAAGHRDLHDLGRLMLNQGARPDEILSLAKANIDLERGQARITKGKSRASRRTLDLTTESRRILGERMDGGSLWIFPAPRNPGQHIARLNSAHDRICAAALEGGCALSFVMYDFRHTFATRMAEAGIDLATLAAILGHNSIRMVQKYVHITAEHKRAAMARYDEKMQAAETARAANAVNLRVN